jgi:hypothetical protein
MASTWFSCGNAVVTESVPQRGSVWVNSPVHRQLSTVRSTHALVLTRLTTTATETLSLPTNFPQTELPGYLYRSPAWSG